MASRQNEASRSFRQGKVGKERSPRRREIGRWHNAGICTRMANRTAPRIHVLGRCGKKLMSAPRLCVLLVQLPIPPPGLLPVHGNIPLAAGYLKLFARTRGLEEAFTIEIFPPRLANTLGDRGLVAAILDRRPWLVGFSCYVWNIERALWIAARLKEADPHIQIVLGGPEITEDNAWVLAHPAVDYAVLGEGEQTFAELLAALRPNAAARGGKRGATGGKRPRPATSVKSKQRGPVAGGTNTFAVPRPWKARSASASLGIPGLWCQGMTDPPPRRSAWTNLDALSSPYLEGILDADEEQTMFLETVRGCAFRCKFCYYPKSYDAVHRVSYEKIAAQLRYAAQRGVKEIVLLDPTLNQRPDFVEFLSLLAQHNSGRQWTCFGELRAEGIDAHKARLLREAGFTEVEVGLQSLDDRAQRLMGRKVNRKAFERGVKAMLDEGLKVRVDLILGLPGDTPDSVRRNIDYLHGSKLYSEIQVFNLSVLPGTAFRREAAQLGLEFQSRPPYYAIQTPTLGLEQLYELMEEVQEAFGLEFDPWPPPTLPDPASADRMASADVHGSGGSAQLDQLYSQVVIDLDGTTVKLPEAEKRALAFSLLLRSRQFEAKSQQAALLVREVLDANPHTSLDVLIAPIGSRIHHFRSFLDLLSAECFRTTSYLDLYYSLHPNPLAGAKRLVVVFSLDYRNNISSPEIDRIAQHAKILWHDST